MLRLQQIIAILILGGSLIAIVDGRDRGFPFSTYPMYSKLFRASETSTIFGVRGVLASGEERLLEVARVLSPFWLASYREALLVDQSEAALVSKLGATREWYNRQQSLSQGQAAELVKLRLYRYDLPLNELTEDALAKGGLGRVFSEHATLELEVPK